MACGTVCVGSRWFSACLRPLPRALCTTLTARLSFRQAKSVGVSRTPLTHTGGIMLAHIRSTLRRDDGASAVEYGLLIAAVAGVLAGVVFLLGGKVKASFAQTCSSLSTSSSTC